MTSISAAGPPGPRLGFLHTSPVHVAVFEGLVGVADASATAASLVEETLLSSARSGARSEDLAPAVRSALAELTRSGAEVVVCTCSTIGDLVETVGRETGVPVVRVDRPMADRAVRTAGPLPGEPVRVLVVIALDSTLRPTTDLLAASATDAGRTVEVEVLRCDDAWPLFEEGRPAEFAGAVAASVRAALDPAPGPGHPPVDVVVLAQASMAPAADLLRDLDVPVLASPTEAVRHALGVVTVARRRRELSA